MLSKFILLAVVYSLCCNMGTPWVQVRQITKWQMKRIRGTDIELAAKYSGPSYSPAQWTAKSGDGDVDVDGDRDEIDKGLLLVQLFRVFRLFAVFVCCVSCDKNWLAVWPSGCLAAWLPGWVSAWTFAGHKTATFGASMWRRLLFAFGQH